MHNGSMEEMTTGTAVETGRARRAGDGDGSAGAIRGTACSETRRLCT